MSFNAGITGIGQYLPEEKLTNKDLEKIVETNDEWITTRTGIKERRIAPLNISTSDLVTNASKEAIQMANIKPEEIDLIIVGTVTPDMMYPCTAAIVQNNIGAVNAGAFDLSAGCTGFIYGVTIATQFIENGMYKNVLVAGSDILSRVTDFTDRNTCVLFGDGAGAVVISRTNEEGIINTFIKADGSGNEYLTLPAGNSKMPPSIETVEKRLHYTQMNGTEVFKFAVRTMPEAVHAVLENTNYKYEDIDYLIPHQANIRIIEAAAKRLNLPMDRVGVSLDKYGNMSSASIPVTMYQEYKEGKFKKGDKLVLVGFGAGLTYGSILLNWLI